MIIELISKMLTETNPDQAKKILVELYQKIGSPDNSDKHIAAGLSNGDLIKAVRDFCSTPNHKNKQRLETL